MGEVLAVLEWEPEFRSQHPREELGMAAPVFNLNAGEP